MKLNIFSYVYWPEQFLVNDLAEEFAKKNHQTEVLTGLPNYPKGDFYPNYTLLGGPYSETHNNVKIRRYPILPRKKGFLRLAVNYVSHIVGATFSIFTFPKADWAFVFATSPITTAIPAILWAKLKGAKVCIWLQDLWPDSVAAVGAMGRSSLPYKILGAVVRWVYIHTDLMLIQSPGFISNLKEFNYTGPYYVIPNWAPTMGLDNPQRPNWLPQYPGKFVATFAGNIGKAQSIDTVVGAAQLLKENPNIQFVLVGDGSDLERAKTNVKNAKLTNIEFYGRHPLQEMPGLFFHSDALMVTLSKDPIFAKTIPSKLQAYMAAAKPIIGSLDGTGAEVIGAAGCGLAAPAEDTEGLASIIQRLAAMPHEDRKKMGDSALSYFYENYRKELIIEKILDLLEKN